MALAQNANTTPLRGESLGMVKSNPHCHCYHDLKGTLKVNPHCTMHGSASECCLMCGSCDGCNCNNSLRGTLQGTKTYKRTTAMAVAGAVSVMAYDRYKFGDWKYGMTTQKGKALTRSAIGFFAGWALGGLANWECIP